MAAAGVPIGAYVDYGMKAQRQLPPLTAGMQAAAPIHAGGGNLGAYATASGSGAPSQQEAQLPYTYGRQPSARSSGSQQQQQQQQRQPPPPQRSRRPATLRIALQRDEPYLAYVTRAMAESDVNFTEATADFVAQGGIINQYNTAQGWPNAPKR